MSDTNLRIKPLERAQKLLYLLDLIHKQRDLNPEQLSAWHNDLQAIERLISMLENANTKDDWRGIWETIVKNSREFGGYVGDDLGQILSRSMDLLWHDILDSYSAIQKSN